MKTLTKEETGILITCLCIAADKINIDIEICTEGGQLELAQDFTKKCKEIRNLIPYLREAKEIRLDIDDDTLTEIEEENKK